MPSLPGYYEAADPAKYYAEGLKIAQSRAAQTAEAQQRDQAGQRAEAELRLRQQELEQQATRAAQKYAAQRQYQDAIQSGQDPLQAVLKYGPAMGEGVDTGIALRASQAQQPKPPLPLPAFQTIQGPDGKPMKVMMQAGHIINPDQYTPKPPPVQETWTKYKDPDTGIPMIKSSKTGRPDVDPAFKEQQRQQGQQRKLLTQQQNAQLKQANKDKADLLKVLDDERELTAKTQQKNAGKIATNADKEKVRADLQKQVDRLDEQIDKLKGGGEATDTGSIKPDTGSEKTNSGSKTLKFTRDKDGNLVLSQ